MKTSSPQALQHLGQTFSHYQSQPSLGKEGKDPVLMTFNCWKLPIFLSGVPSFSHELRQGALQVMRQGYEVVIAPAPGPPKDILQRVHAIQSSESGKAHGQNPLPLLGVPESYAFCPRSEFIPPTSPPVLSGDSLPSVNKHTTWDKKQGSCSL